MGKKDKAGGRFELSRRDFIKVAGASAAAVTVMEPLMPAPAAAVQYLAADIVGGVPQTTSYISTCPYCSAQCGQTVVVGNVSHKVYDIYGDVTSPTNNGGLCAKGAGSLQLVNNVRRLGVPEHTAAVDGQDFSGTAWKRTGNGGWTEIPLAQAITESATAMYNARGGAITADGDNRKSVQFFGSSHINNEQNYLYRKIIANFGTSNVEHQARI